MEKLGGRRKEVGDLSKDSCWRNTSFRNYADYMETGEFLEGIDELIQIGKSEVVSIMCAEAVYWRCPSLNSGLFQIG